MTLTETREMLIPRLERRFNGYTEYVEGVCRMILNLIEQKVLEFLSMIPQLFDIFAPTHSLYSSKRQSLASISVLKMDYDFEYEANVDDWN